MWSEICGDPDCPNKRRVEELEREIGRLRAENQKLKEGAEQSQQLAHNMAIQKDWTLPEGPEPDDAGPFEFDPPYVDEEDGLCPFCFAVTEFKTLSPYSDEGVEYCPECGWEGDVD